MAEEKTEGQAPAVGGPEQELDVGPYGLRGKDTPPLQNMFGGYAIIFAAVILIPLVLFVVVRFLIL